MQVIETIPRLPQRPIEAHKGDFGKVCIVAGSLGMSGAAALAGLSALRAGAGLVRVAAPKGIVPIVAAIEPSFTTIPLAEDDSGRISAEAVAAVLDAAEMNDAMAFGPGVGLSGDLRMVVGSLLERQGLQLVIDADGLNNLAAMGDWPGRASAELVLTPHPGEFKRLWAALLREPLPGERAEQAVRLSKRCGAVVVLKGAGTVVSDGRRLYTNTTGNPGMATAGSGDVLTGVITALLGQGLGAFEAAVLGVYAHGLAGDIAAERLGQTGMIAGDIAAALPEAFARPG